MKAVKRWRYYCDHCKKVSGSRPGMEKHEKGCTLNPNRECGICGFLSGGSPAPLSELLALLPDPAKFVVQMPPERDAYGPIHDGYEWSDDEALRAAVHAVLPQLRELTEDCPACILAALRQRGIPVPVVTDFNFTDELKDAQQRMSEHRAEQAPTYGYGGY